MLKDFPYFTFFILLILATIKVISQDIDPNDTEPKNINETVEFIEYSEDQVEYIEYRQKNKINLYRTNLDELTKFPYFDVLISKKIINYVKNNPNNTIAKLSKDLNLIGEQMIILQHCTYIQETKRFEKSNYYSRFKSTFTDDPIYGFEKDKFKGSPFNYNWKSLVDLDNFHTGFMLDKDEGEINSVDFYSAFIQYKSPNKFNIILGDFEYQLGMGNVLWKSFGDRKGINNISPIVRNNQLAKPYKSSLDFSFFRGIALDYQFSIFGINNKVGGFTSYQNYSGTLDSTREIISSIYNVGLYRTESEIAKKSTFNEFSYSINWSIDLSDLNIGVGLFSISNNKDIQTSSSKFINGKNNLFKTLFLNYQKQNFATSSEVSFDGNNNLAITFGGLVSNKNNKIALNFRSFSENFRSPYGSHFGEFSYPSNELGLYLAWTHNKTRNYTFTNFIDFFKSYGKTYYLDIPTTGFTAFSQFDYSKIRNLIYSLRAQLNNKTEKFSNDDVDKYYSRDNIRIRNEFFYKINSNFKMRVRAEYSYISNKGFLTDESGLAGFVELSYSNWNWTFGSRYSMFSTDSYNSAIWQYEYFMPGNMYSFPAYLQGNRIVVFVNYNLLKKFKIFTIFTNTFKNNVDHLSSGYDEVFRNYSNSLILQAIIDL